MSGTTSTWSAPRGRTRAGKSRWRARSTPATSRWTGTGGRFAALKGAKASPGANTRTDRRARLTVKAGFSTADCWPCPARPRCTRAANRYLGLLPRPEQEAIAAARARLNTEAGRKLYSQRQGVESTISQGVRSFGLRQARYRSLAKVGLQSVATAAAINLDRLAAWFAQRPLAPTRTSRFAAVAA